MGITSVMNNPQLARLVADAVASPPGSLKRERAAAVLRSINKANQKGMDGQGGLSVSNQPAGASRLRVAEPSRYPSLLSPMKQPSVSGLQRGVANPQAGMGIQGASTGPLQGTVPSLQGPGAGSWIILNGPPELKPSIPMGLAEQGAPLQVAPSPFAPPTAPPPPIAPPSTTPFPTGNYYEELFKSLPKSEQDRLQFLFESVQAGVGPGSFSMAVKEDKEKLRKFLPGVPEDALPVGASLVKQLDDLEKSLKQKYNIEAQEENLKNLQERGLNIEQDLGGYMTARDKYIERLDGMIDKAKDSMLNMDTANPAVNTMANNYMNYLYVLKGRQQKRYGDFLALGVKQYEVELSQAQRAYDSNYKRMQDELTRKAAYTKEWYGQVSDTLEEMYKNLENQEKKYYDMGILKNNWYQEQFKSAKAVFDATSGTSLTPEQTTIAQSNFWNANPDKATIEQWNQLRPEEKVMWYKAKDAGDKTFKIQFYMDAIKRRNLDFVAGIKKGVGEDAVPYEKDYKDTSFDEEMNAIMWPEIPKELWEAIQEKIKTDKEEQARVKGESTKKSTWYNPWTW